MLILGSPGNDTLLGTDQDDDLHGFDGDDVLSGLAGPDFLRGYAGSDSLAGGDGRDFLDGGAGDDLLDGGAELDWALYGGSAGPVQVSLLAGTASGADGNDTLVSIENVAGSAFDDLLIGDDFANALQGEGGNDTLHGNGGDDFLVGGAGNDLIDAGAHGIFGDQVSYVSSPSGVNVNLATGAVSADGWGGSDTLVGVEHVDGSDFDDVLVGSAVTNWFRPHAGNDFVDGAGGQDVVMYEEQAAGVTIDLQLGFARGSSIGEDTVLGVEAAHGSFHDDSIRLSDTDGYVFGRGGNDALRGGMGNDNLIGGSGDDLLDGGAGFDNASYFVDGFDVPVTGLGVTVSLQTGLATDNWGHTDTLSNIEGVQGSMHDDLLGGDGLANALSGEAGNDSLHGNGGDDFLVGGAGDDLIDGGAEGFFGDEVSYFTSLAGVDVNLATGVVTADGWGGSDTLVDVEHVEGSNFNDVLVGSAETNWFRPHAGDDFVDGADGRDVVMYEGEAAGVTIDLQLGFARGSTIGEDTVLNVEAAHGSSHDDSITLSNRQGYVFGRAGNDALRGGSAGDNFIGGSGNDAIEGGGGFDNVDYFDDGFDGPTTGLGVTVNLQTGLATDNWGDTDTLASIEGVAGSIHDDLIIGSDAFNRAEFFNGNDGDDSLQGGGGNDAFVGGRGNDVIQGGTITDLINFVDLNSVNYSSSEAGIVMDLATGIVQDGLGGVDTLSDINFVTGSSFDDRITGSSGVYFEQFDGGLGDDTIEGGAIDPITFANANRVTYFAAGSAVNVDLAAGTASGGLGNDTLININHVFGSRFGDVLTGSDSATPESFNGRGGNDTIHGAGGIDEARYNNAGGAVNVNLASGVALDGEGGTDTLSSIEGVRGSNFADLLTGGNAASDELEFFMGMGGNDLMDGGSGFDRADYTSSTTGVTATLGGTADGMALDGLGGTDVLRNIEALRGSFFHDTLTGSDSGAFESFEGRDGNDLIDGKGGTDRADYVSTIAGVVVDLATGTAADGYGSTDTLLNIENVRGGAFADRIAGNALANLLQGGGGNDSLAGGAGDDLLGGGAGNDLLAGGEGLDQFLYQASGNGVDTISDFVRGDTLLVSALVSGRSAAGNGGTVLAGQMQVSAAGGTTTLYIGTDATAGADIEVRLSGSFGATDFVALANANGSTSIGLAENNAPARVAELAVQLRATGKAHADVAANVAGRSTTNEVAVGRLLAALDQVQAGQGGAGDFAGLAGDPAGGVIDMGLVGVQPLLPEVV